MSGFISPPPSVAAAIAASKVREPFFIEHATADFLLVVYKLDLADQFIVTNRTERMWDVDSLEYVDDVIGYELWYTE